MFILKVIIRIWSTTLLALISMMVNLPFINNEELDKIMLYEKIHFTYRVSLRMGNVHFENDYSYTEHCTFSPN